MHVFSVQRIQLLKSTQLTSGGEEIRCIARHAFLPQPISEHLEETKIQRKLSIAVEGYALPMCVNRGAHRNHRSILLREPAFGVPFLKWIPFHVDFGLQGCSEQKTNQRNKTGKNNTYTPTWGNP